MSSDLGHPRRWSLILSLLDMCISEIQYDVRLCLIFLIGSCEMKKRKFKEEERRKFHEAEKAKEEQLSKKRRREERREKFREQDKLKKKIRRDSGA
ncbi:unnamed protein product [Ilex paraguariensis]|uniref:Uncharacterized protein n=1 Tax=Ilex paraguariensis TaxID=185542 RepID=A0ABC8SGC4_9AQUA